MNVPGYLARLAATGKAATLEAMRLAGAFERLGRSNWRRERLLILCYHGVSQADEHLWSDVYVSEQHLRRRLQTLQRFGCSVLPLDEAVGRLSAGTLPERAVSLTFDDGAVDFYRKAYPLLSEYRYPVTLYLTTYYCTFQRPVFSTVSSYLLWKGRDKQVDMEGLTTEGGTVGPGASPALRGQVHGSLLRCVSERGLSAGEKDELARTLASRVGVDYDEILESRLLHLMNPHEVRALSQSLVSIQLHTHRHRTPLDRELFRRELADNRDAIRSMGAGTAKLHHFCYPSGRYAPRLMDWLREEAALVKKTMIVSTGIALVVIYYCNPLP